MRRVAPQAPRTTRGRGNPVTARNVPPPRKRPRSTAERWAIRCGIAFGICAIVGGAGLWSVQSGWLGDRFGLRASMGLLFLTLGYILSVGFWARPLVANATVPLRELLRSRRQAEVAAPPSLR